MHWPSATGPAASTSALFSPYRPADLTAELPCASLRWTGDPSTVLATGANDTGLTVTTAPTGIHIRTDDADLEFPVRSDVSDCRVTIAADATGLSVAGAGERLDVAGQAVPRVFAFRTDADSTTASGLSVTVHTRSPFATSPTALKTILVAVQLLCAAIGLLALAPRRRPSARRFRPHPRRAWTVDVCVVGLLGGWAVIGPLAVDDGWAAMIARTFAETGSPGNFYRWWNASEVPFALSQEVLSRFAEVSVAPLWLRVPSTLLGIATWLMLSRGVLGAALPVRARSTGVRALSAVFFLTAWLPFNLGTRPESYVALGVTAVTALLWRSRTPLGIGVAALAAALTVPVSPTAVMLIGPVVVLAPRALAVVRRGAANRLDVAVSFAVIACLAATALTIVFADQTWDALRTATDWHAFFGPTLPWSSEPDRYSYLLGDDQQGSFAKRAPVLIALALLPTVAVLVGLRRPRGLLEAAALRLGAMLVIGVAALAFVPSKWSYHLGATAGLLAAFSTVAVVLACRRAREPGVRSTAAALLCIGSGSVAAAYAFAGPNAWWLSANYDVPWSEGPIRPLGLPLDNPVFWLAVAGVLALTRLRRGGGAARATGTAVVVAASATALSVLVGSFVAAPIRRPAGSLALANLNRLHDPRDCGFADDIQVLPDGPALTPIGADEVVEGFTLAGHYPGAPPPGMDGSTLVWGSRGVGPETTGRLTTRWFALPPRRSDTGVAVSVSGRLGEGNSFAFEYGRDTPAGVVPLGVVAPVDRIAVDEDPRHPLWRTVGVDADTAPAGADRVRIRAVDGRTDDLGWLAVTGPRVRSIIGLIDFLATRGPVLVAWPQSFLFPCVVDIPRVAVGLAQTPDTVIESPRPYFAEDRNQSIGGTFAGVAELDGLQEIPTRVRGHPEVDWGSLRIWSGAVARDRYDLTVERDVVAGVGGTPRQPPERP